MLSCAYFRTIISSLVIFLTASTLFVYVRARYPQAERKEQNAAKAAENAEKRALQNEERKKKNAEAKEAAKTQVSSLAACFCDRHT